MTCHRIIRDLIITPILLKKEIYTIFGKSLRLPIENQIPETKQKSWGFVVETLKVQKVTVSKEREILPLGHHLVITEEIDENELFVLVVVFFHSFDRIRTLIRQEL